MLADSDPELAAHGLDLESGRGLLQHADDLFLREPTLPHGASFVQVVLGIYRDDVNKQRPHSSLGQKTPAEFYAGTQINADSIEAPKRVA